LPTDFAKLEQLGWDEFFAQQLTQVEADLVPMRVSIEHQDRYTLTDGENSLDAHLRGRLLKDAKEGGPRPVVGDWVGLSKTGTINHLFKRRSAFRRTSPRGKVQVIASNIDLVLIVTSCNAEFNIRRIERYLSAVSESGAEAALVLSKIDLCDDPQSYIDSLKKVAGSTPIFPVATPSGVGVEAIRPTLRRGRTLALVGSSGVGKSTLANALLGTELFATAPIREQDAKGRHTTTRRELVLLSQDRGVLIDTPGMRELQLISTQEGLEGAFEDVHELATQCQFRDCRHLKEPGCAVRGQIDPDRLKSFYRLRDEKEDKRPARRGKKKS
jgi:ribosome biogenesis GTPase